MHNFKAFSGFSKAVPGLGQDSIIRFPEFQQNILFWSAKNFHSMTGPKLKKTSAKYRQIRIPLLLKKTDFNWPWKGEGQKLVWNSDVFGPWIIFNGVVILLQNNKITRPFLSDFRKLTSQ